ncbi:MAG: hypothetical protein U1E59_20320 [Amaricoccus sp.]
MAEISVRWADDHLKKYGDRLDELDRRFPKALPRIVNQVGNRAKTQVVRNLTAQTGLPRKTIVKAIGNPSLARPGKLSYGMVTHGGNVRLKYLAPRETRKGVTAIPWGKRQLFPGTFMKGGVFPDRVMVKAFGGHVFRRLNKTGTRITQARSGMAIPAEMLKGATAKAFRETAAPLLDERVKRVLDKLVP